MRHCTYEFNITRLVSQYIDDENEATKLHNKEVSRWNARNPDKRQRAKIIFNREKAKADAWDSLRSLIRELKRGTQDNRTEAKLLELEIEYVRILHKETLAQKIQEKTKQFPSGIYSLEEIGKIFNIATERARQIEAGAAKKLKHPRIGKFIQNALSA